MSVHEHKKNAASNISVSVITVSDTRTIDTDKSGNLIVEYLKKHGHNIFSHIIIPDEAKLIKETIITNISNKNLDVIILTGGTGISPRDVTYETVKSLIDKEIPGYGELFRILSYQEIGASSILSRAIAGICSNKLIIATPGSSNAVKLAMEKIIIPELGHLVGEIHKKTSTHHKI